MEEGDRPCGFSGRNMRTQNGIRSADFSPLRHLPKPGQGPPASPSPWWPLGREPLLLSSAPSRSSSELTLAAHTGRREFITSCDSPSEPGTKKLSFATEKCAEVPQMA